MRQRRTTTHQRTQAALREAARRRRLELLQPSWTPRRSRGAAPAGVWIKGAPPPLSSSSSPVQSLRSSSVALLLLLCFLVRSRSREGVVVQVSVIGRHVVELVERL